MRTLLAGFRKWLLKALLGKANQRSHNIFANSTGCSCSIENRSLTERRSYTSQERREYRFVSTSVTMLAGSQVEIPLATILRHGCQSVAIQYLKVSLQVRCIATRGWNSLSTI